MQIARAIFFTSPEGKKLMTGRTLSLSDTRYEYILAHSVREPPMLARRR
jgi:hypothetical protein